MVIKMNDNPLGTPQRETAGADTFSKYEYQYHWALCRIIDEHREKREYALFMEYHEDVTIASSLQSEIATFEFNQVKNTKKPKYNVDNLLKVKKRGKNSVLGKLISSMHNKPFKDKLTSINLVASCGFSFDLTSNGLNLEVITTGDLSKQSIDKLKSSLDNELGIQELPSNLRFIIPNLAISEQQDTVIGKIAKMIADIFPNSHCNAQDIYRGLIDDLHRKGVIEYDYNKWDDLLKKKALTSTQVDEVIIKHTELPKIQEIYDGANDIATEMTLGFREKRMLKESLRKIHTQVIGFPSKMMLGYRKKTYDAICSVPKEKKENLSIFITEIELLIPNKEKEEMSSVYRIRDIIIYELITRGSEVWD